jgi:hypothetical protein
MLEPLDFYGQGTLRLEPKPAGQVDVPANLERLIRVRIHGDVQGSFLLGAYHDRTDGQIEEMANVLAARLVQGLGADLDVMITPPEKIDPRKVGRLQAAQCFTLWHEEGASRTPLFAAAVLARREGETAHA